MFAGGSPPEIPLEGIFLFPSTPSSWLHSHPGLIVSVVPSISPYCAWFVSLMFQTQSLTVSCLSHRCPQIFLLCCACSHNTVKTHPPCTCLGQSCVPKARISCLFVSVTAMFKLLTSSSVSCSVPDTNTRSSRNVGPNVHPPGQPPIPVTDFHLLYLMSISVLLFRTCCIYSPWKKQGKDPSEENSLCSNLGGKLKTDSSLPVPWPQALLLWNARFPGTNPLLKRLGQGWRHHSVY